MGSTPVADYIAIWAVVWGVLCALVASSRGRGGLGWFILGALFGVFAFIGLIASGNRTGIKDGKACPTCAQQIVGAAYQCPHCGHRFAPHTVSLPTGWPHWPGMGQKVQAFCNRCDAMRAFDDQALCAKCGKQDPLLRYFWGFRPERPTADEIQAIKTA